MRWGGVDGMDDSQVLVDWEPNFVVGQKNCRQVRSGVGDLILAHGEGGIGFGFGFGLGSVS